MKSPSMTSCARSAPVAVGQVDEGSLDAPADVGGLGEAEIEEDRVEVLLDGALGQHEIVGDALVAEAARDVGEDLELARREVGERRMLAAPSVGDQPLDDLGVDYRPALGNGFDGRHQLSAVLDALLEQVRPSVG